MDNQKKNVINASPTKDFFIRMLVKDIGLIRAIIDLVDNCIDGARRIRKDDNYKNLSIRIEANNEIFKISDNCGGISVDIARNYAFRFGRPTSTKAIPHSIGQFGVGMKRAIFKLGKKIQIESRSKTSHFVVDVDVDKWRQKEEWEFEFKVIEENAPQTLIENCGTIITVTSLHESVKNDFELENFMSRLTKEIEEAHVESLDKNLTITINSIPLKTRSLKLLNSASIVSAHKKMSFKEGGNDNSVDVKLYAGILTPSPQDAGWYIFCNGRLILGADQSEITGWGEDNSRTIPKYHNDFARFRGYVFFDSDDASLLPWNTTKTGIDTDFKIFRSVRLEMIKMMRVTLDFLRKLSNERNQEIETDKPLEAAIKSASEMELSNLETNDVFIFPTPKQNSKSSKLGRISYTKPKEQIKLVKKTLGAKTLKEVGEKTFEYFVNMECEDG